MSLVAQRLNLPRSDGNRWTQLGRSGGGDDASGVLVWSRPRFSSDTHRGERTTQIWGFLFKASWSGFIARRTFILGHLSLFLDSIFSHFPFVLLLLSISSFCNFWAVLASRALSWFYGVYLPGEAEKRHGWVFTVYLITFLFQPRGSHYVSGKDLRRVFKPKVRGVWVATYLTD